MADTSVFIAQEGGRPLSGRPPERVAVSVVTVPVVSEDSDYDAVPLIDLVRV